MKDLMGMIPGVGKAINHVEIDDDAFKPIEPIIDSMTPVEREGPDANDTKRRMRIATAAGTDINGGNKSMKRFADMRKVMKQMSNPGMAAKMMRNMPKMPGKPF